LCQRKSSFGVKLLSGFTKDTVKNGEERRGQGYFAADIIAFESFSFQTQNLWVETKYLNLFKPRSELVNLLVFASLFTLKPDANW